LPLYVFVHCVQKKQPLLFSCITPRTRT